MATLAFIGCGNMGSAILSGLLDATRSNPSNHPITRFVVNTKSESSAAHLRTTYSSDSARLQITHGQNVPAMQDADIILLACKPFLAESILSEEGVRDAVAGKLVISIMAGKSPAQIRDMVKDHDDYETTIARANPNVGARIRQSMTVVEVNESLPQDRADVLSWIFRQIGEVKFLAPELFDAGTMLVGASMATMSIPLEGILDGSVMEGIRRADALEMAAQTLKGMAGLLREGTHPAVLREIISSPRGCTIQGVVTVEKAGVRGTFAEAMVNGTQHLKK